VQAQLPGAPNSTSTAMATTSTAPSSSKKSAKKAAKSAKRQAKPLAPKPAYLDAGSPAASHKLLERSAQEWAGSVLCLARMNEVLASALLDSRQLLDWLEVWCAVLPLTVFVNTPTGSQVVSQCSHH
jgi:hypothetical protein